MDALLTTLLEAAGLAPSGDNCQPWRFEVDEASRTIALTIDPSRDPSPMNAGQRMARIAVGAALENLLRAARRVGADCAVTRPATGAAAIVAVRPTSSPRAVAIDRDSDTLLARRVTNRRVYLPTTLDAEMLDGLRKETPSTPIPGATHQDVATHWITEPSRLASAASLIAAADATMFGEPSMRRAFLANIRFDAPPLAKVELGLSLGSLEVGLAERWAMRMMRYIPQWLFELGGARNVFERQARKLLASSAGLCLIVAPDSAPGTDVEVGVAMQRAWLALAARDLAVQPMMSLAVLENALESGGNFAWDSSAVRALVARSRETFPELGAGHIGFLLRFGKAPDPTGRTGRLDPSASIAFTSSRRQESA